MGLGHRLAHSAACLYRRAGVLYCCARRPLLFPPRRSVAAAVAVLDTHFLGIASAMGVVSGIIMPFQFGTNWARFSDAAANVVSPMLAYEDLMAFFLEATFLGILLFGRSRVPPWVHFLAACMVAIGTLFSSFWILSVNSWMQTPTGYEMHRRPLLPGRLDGRSFSIHRSRIVSPQRLRLLITTGFVVLGVGAWLVRRGRSVGRGRRMVPMALGFRLCSCRCKSCWATSMA